jgi:hypothetical protein
MVHRIVRTAVLSVAVLSVGFAGLLATPGTASAGQRNAGEQWVTFSPKEGNFTVKLPGEPEELSQDIGGSKGAIYGYTEGDAGVYLVGYVDLPEGTVTGDNASEVLDKLVEESGKGEGLVLKSKAITLGKHPGREFIVNVPEIDGSGKCRIYLVGSRLYLTVAVGTEEFMGNKNVDTFLNSFKLTK